MPFSYDQFSRTRPYLFHLTAQSNVRRIRRTRVLYSAETLMRKAGDTSMLRQKRFVSRTVQIKEDTVNIRDQQPLHAGNISFVDGWSFEDVIKLLNERVFFWPGTSIGPIGYGKRHYKRYIEENPSILRVSTQALFGTNLDVSPTFCRYNSGSPRCSKGVGSPRGAKTFVVASEADFTPNKVVEVTYSDRVTLPDVVEFSNSVSGPWRSLF